MKPLQRPVFRPHFTVHPVAPDRLILISETQELVLRGAFYHDLAPWIDGRSVDDIVQALQGTASGEDVRAALDILRRGGYVQEACDGDPGASAFWSAMGVHASDFADLLAKVTVGVRTLGDIPAQPFRDALAALGLREGPDPRFELVLADDYLNPALEACNRDALAARRPWLLAKPLGRQPWVGPLMLPGKGPCWCCLADRLRTNRQTELAVKGRDRFVPTAQGGVPLSLNLVAHRGALEVARWLAGASQRGAAHSLLSWDLLTDEERRHPVVRRPQCPACGEPAAPDASRAAPIELRDTPLSAGEGGGLRTLTPAQVMQRYEVHVSPLTGVVSGLHKVGEDAEGPVHVFNSGFNLSRSGTDAARALRTGFRSQSSGKGRSALEARVGALCEAIERHSAAWRGEEPAIVSSLAKLGGQALHPNAIMGFSERQYSRRARWNAAHIGAHRVPEPLDPHADTHWSPVWNLSRGTTMFLPTGHCYYQCGLPGSRLHSVADSNGNAAGSSIEDAILQGFFELVERDAVALWWYSRASRPGVDIACFADPFFDELCRHYARQGRDLWALDLTTDLGLPAFVAVSATREGGRHISCGFGAHADARVALTRALTEVNQMLATMPDAQADAGAQNDGPDAAPARWYLSATLDQHPYLRPDQAAAARSPADFPAQRWSGGREAVLACQRTVESLGLEMLVLDQTRPDIGLPVVKVMVPGLRHFWPRYAPGRLYDTPVQLGWIDRRLTEDELNPTPIFW